MSYVDMQSASTYVDIIAPPNPAVLTGPWVMKRGSLQPAYRGTLRRADKSPVDLSDPQIDHVTFVMRQRRTLTPVVEAAATIIQAGDADTGTDVGVCEYEWQPGDTDTSGDYYGEFAVYDANGHTLARIPNDGYQEIRILGNLSQAPTMPPPADQTVSALPEAVDLNVYAGDDFSVNVTVTEPDGTPAVLDGATLQAQIRPWLGSPTVLTTFTATGAGSVVTLQLAGTVTATLPPEAVYDCEWVDRNLTLIRGSVYTSPQVTQ